MDYRVNDVVIEENERKSSNIAEVYANALAEKKERSKEENDA